MRAGREQRVSVTSWKYAVVPCSVGACVSGRSIWWQRVVQSCDWLYKVKLVMSVTGLISVFFRFPALLPRFCSQRSVSTHEMFRLCVVCETGNWSTFVICSGKAEVWLKRGFALHLFTREFCDKLPTSTCA